jgi:hypothetical protein
VSDPPQPEDDPLRTALRVDKLFMIPFLLSWALALIGSNRDIEWLYYLGLGGVGVTTTGLMIWLIH